VDGSAAVELVKPTQNPRLNRLLLDTLKTWRFMPAIKDGQPAPSVEVMIIRLHVD
jgi:protein TonB